MHSPTAASSVVVGALIVASCGGANTSATVTGPGSTEPVTASLQAPKLSVTAATASQSIGRPACPAVPPFTVSFGLSIHHAGDFNLFITQIRLQFVDRFGVRMPQVTLPGPVPTVEFGTMLVQARSGRTIPISFGVGCGTDRKGTVMVQVDTRDELGRTGSGQATAPVN